MHVDKSLVEEALKLTPQEKVFFIETLVRSLDNPDPKLEKIWAEEAEARLKAHREGRTKGLAVEKVLGGPL